ncbi:hypothetical protein [Acetobacteroides hydrogenigenes]|uniref:GcrA cell cycle regulator n=1 Tax=Acetobacteroides hydrogenigenes TaxID=979970 RepID=A0A4R2ENM4_9BACT|nr:hypothetical protein [Acetobacteroides hydrogenigenes]TCN68882.1 hypothetical protein CLV25_10584 [Acetobacteroides hydrogenigenes]
MNKPKNHGKQWSENDVERLRVLINGNTPTGIIAFKLGRSEDAIRTKANGEGFSLKPTNQSPYNRNDSKGK